MKLLDGFCGLGGAGMGYARAGFEVTGVDIVAQPDYPFTFVLGDALAYAVEHRDEFDAFHYSPPCQASSNATKGNRARPGWTDTHVDLIPSTRDVAEWIDRPYVIENVQGSQLRRDLILCGLMFDLRVFRHRYFELGGWSMPQPPMPSHRGHRVSGWRHGVRYEGDMLAVYGEGGGKASTQECREGLGIDWSWDRDQLVEAIPPAYTHLIGVQLHAALSMDIEVAS